MIRVGQKLHDERIKKGLTLSDVEKATRIKAPFLSAIEKGEYYKLPSSAYAQGFVNNYAQFLGLPKRETLAIFRREFDEEKMFRVLPESMTKRQEFPIRRIRLQQTVLTVATILFVLLGYILFQYRYAILNPPLTITSPVEGALTTADVTINGKTDPSAIVYINSTAVPVSSDGTFIKRVTAFSGKVALKITARNRLGKETTVVRNIVVQQ